MRDEEIEKVNVKEEPLNSPEIDIDRNKWLINYLTKQPLLTASSPLDTVNEFLKLLNRCSNLCFVLCDKRKAAIIYLLVRNKVAYFGQIKKILKINGGSLAFFLGSGEAEDYEPGLLQRKGIIRRVEAGEFEKEKKILGNAKNSAHKVKYFFCLTDQAREFYSSIPEGELERLSENANLINQKHAEMGRIERQSGRTAEQETKKKEAAKKIYNKVEELKESFAARKENNSLADFKKELLKLREMEEFRAFPDLMHERCRIFFKWPEEKWAKYLDQIRARWKRMRREIEG